MARSWRRYKASSRNIPAPRGGRPTARKRANWSKPALQVLEGRTLPSFVAPALFPVGTNPEALAVGDFNGDGIPDVVTANTGANTLSVLLGNGDGSFQAARTIPVGAVPDAVAVADLAGNGILDLVVADGGNPSDHRGSDVQVLLGNGDGTFQKPVSYGAGINNPRGVTVADLNGDGIPDLAVADGGRYPDNSGGGIWVLLGKGDGSFQPGELVPTGVGTKAVAVGDFNGDGILDLAAANAGPDFSYTGSSLSVLLGNGDGTYQAPVNYDVGMDPTAVAVADFNGDGKADLVATTYGVQGAAGVNILLGRGDGTFAAPVKYAILGGAESVAVGDLNGDGVPDIVAGSIQTNDGGASVLLGAGDGSFAAPVTYGVGSSPFAVALADVNGDGAADLITADFGFNFSGGNISVVLGNGDGTFRIGVSYPVTAQPNTVTVRDLTGDGIPDVVTSSLVARGGVSVLLGNGDGTYRPATFYDTDQPPVSLVVADVNGDGIPDIVTVGSNNFLQPGTVSVLLGNGDGTFRPAVSFAAGSPPGALLAADFNGDGKTDLAIGSSTFNGNTVTILLGNGDGTFQTPRTFTVGGVSSLAVGDFNHDGIPDLIALNPTMNTVDVLLGNGDGTFRPAISTPVAEDPRNLVVGDFNHDGIPDVAVASTPFSNQPPTVSILLGNGDGSFQPAVSSLPVSPLTMAVGDVNNDGILDLITDGANGVGGVTVWLGNGDGTFQAPQSYYAGFSVGAIALADLNGDGFPDLVATNVSGNVRLLFNAADWGGAHPGVPARSRAAVPRHQLHLEAQFAQAAIPDVRTVPLFAEPSGDRSVDFVPAALGETSMSRPVSSEAAAPPHLMHTARNAQDSAFAELGSLLEDHFDPTFIQERIG